MFVITMVLHLSAFEFLLMRLPIPGLDEWCMERTCATTNVRCFCVLVPLPQNGHGGQEEDQKQRVG